MMKFTEAIRLGATMTPQVFQKFYHKGGTCALGGALYALGMLNDEVLSIGKVDLPNEWGWAGDVKIKCPVCAKFNAPFSLLSMITHLNDGHRWTREQIADWVEQYEPKGQATDILPDVPTPEMTPEVTCECCPNIP